MDEQRIIDSIYKLLSSYTTISGGIMSLNSEDKFQYSWRIKYDFSHNGEFIHIIVLPKSEIFNYTNYRTNEDENALFIDIFGLFIKGKNCIKPIHFFEYLANREKFKGHFNLITSKSVIDKHFRKRSISWINNFDNLQFSHSAVETLCNWVEDSSSNSPFLVLGDRGMGKTWMLKKLCQKLYLKHYENPWVVPLPIYINLSILSKNVQDIRNINDVISEALIKQYKIKFFDNGRIFEALLMSGNIFLAIDGFDEMSTSISDEVLKGHLWDLNSISLKNTKFILTSRFGIFKNKNQILKYFAFAEFSKNSNETEFFFQERLIRRNFNVIELLPFEDKSSTPILVDLKSKEDKIYSKGSIKLKNLSVNYTKSGDVRYELVELSRKSPALESYIVYLLGIDKFEIINIYEKAISDTIIAYNIKSHRAISEYFKLNEGKVISKGFDERRKNILLSEVAWYLFERNIEEFTIGELTNFLKNQSGDYLTAILNDLKAQTVFIINLDNDRYKFITESIHFYFTSYYLFRNLNSCDKSKTKYALEIIGKYPFERDSGKRVQTFLREFCSKRLSAEAKNMINICCLEILKNSNSLSPWLKYLIKNVNELELKINWPMNQKMFEFSKLDGAKIQHDLENKFRFEFVLIPSFTRKNNLTDPFYVLNAEVTNRQFEFFLKNNNEETTGKNWVRSNFKAQSNPFRNILNQYHLIFWTDDKIPDGKENHPVVYVSWFACAMFCNWLSIKSGLPPYYKFHFKDNDDLFKSVSIIKESDGFRLPTKHEWEVVASELSNINYVTEALINDDGDLTLEGKLKKERLEARSGDSYMVKLEKPNALGVYGLMGNVREWVQQFPTKSFNVDESELQLIKGAAWLTSKEGLKIDYDFGLLAQNTNPDVGFRIARSLNKKDTTYVNDFFSKIP